MILQIAAALAIGAYVVLSRDAQPKRPDTLPRFALLGGAIDHFTLRAQHDNAGLTPFVYANADARTTLWVRNNQLGFLVLIGERNALHSLTALNSTRVRSPIEDIERRAPVCAVDALFFPDPDAVCQLIGVVKS